MKQVNFLKVWLGITIFFSVPTQATTINPQIGDSVWEVIDRIGQNTDETSSTYTAVRSIETKTDALAVNFKETWTTVEALEGGIISIGATGSTYTINSSGRYKLVTDRTNPIIINVNNVCLDLAGFNIIVSSDVDGIKINSGKTRVKINNGRVIQTSSSTKSGILIESSSSRIKIENVELENFNTGVKFNGESDLEVTNSEVTDCNFVLNATGIQLNYSDKNIIKDCTASENDQAGFELFHSEVNCFFDCQALKTQGDASIIAGFKSDSGSCNLFQRCVAKGTETTDTGYADRAYGFLLTGTEENTKIIDCIANETNISTSGDAVPKGMGLIPVFDVLSSSLATGNTGRDIGTTGWSPDRRYIATGEVLGGAADKLRIWTFDGSNLVNIATSSFSETNINSLEWSPDGKHIAITTVAGLKVYSFDGTNITQVGSTMAVNGGQAYGASWSPNGKYISCGSAGSAMYVAKFDGSSLNNVTSYPANPLTSSTDWSPDGKYIATGDHSNFVSIWSFNGKSLTVIDSISAGAAVNSVEWSPNGKYIVSVGVAGTPSGSSFGSIHMWSFDGSAISIVATDGVTTTANSVSWSPSGNMISFARVDSLVQILNFNGITFSNRGASTITGQVLSVDWSPDGRYIVSGDSNDDVNIFSIMNAPQNCFVDGCRVCDTQADTGNLILGTGIAGGGRNNFTDNICCNNEVNFTFGVPNTYFGDQNTMRPFDNLSMPQAR